MSDYAIGYFIPFHRFEIHAGMDPTESCARLQTLTASKWPWFGSPRDKEFIGKVSQNAFRLLRIIKGRNTYNPWILGKCTSASSGGSRVSGVMTLHPIAAVVMVVFFVVAVQPSMSPPQGRWIPAALLSIFHLAMCAFAFVPEVKRNEHRLRELLAAG